MLQSQPSAQSQAPTANPSAADAASVGSPAPSPIIDYKQKLIDKLNISQDILNDSVWKHDGYQPNWQDLYTRLNKLIPSMNAYFKPNHWPLWALLAFYGEQNLYEKLLQNNGTLLKETWGEGKYMCLHMAALGGKQAMFEYFKSKDCDVNCKTANNETIALFAAWGGSLEILKTLEGQLSEKTTNNVTPLQYAVLTDSQAVVEYLTTQNKNDPWEVDSSSENSFHKAAGLGAVNSLRFLLSQVPTGRDINAAKSKEGKNMLAYAAFGGQLNCVKLLVEEYGMLVDEKVVSSARESKNQAVIEYVAGKKTLADDVYLSSKDALETLQVFSATANVWLPQYVEALAKTVQRLRQMQAEPSVEELTTFITACRTDWQGCPEGDIKSKFLGLLNYYHNKTIWEQLKNLCVVGNVFFEATATRLWGPTPYKAYTDQQVQSYKASAITDINKPLDQNNNRLLHIAAMQQDADLWKHCIVSSADVSLKNNKDMTAFQLLLNQPKINLDFLLTVLGLGKVDISELNENKQSLLQIAFQQEWPALVSCLLLVYLQGDDFKDKIKAVRENAFKEMLDNKHIHIVPGCLAINHDNFLADIRGTIVRNDTMTHSLLDSLVHFKSEKDTVSSIIGFCSEKTINTAFDFLLNSDVETDIEVGQLFVEKQQACADRRNKKNHSLLDIAVLQKKDLAIITAITSKSNPETINAGFLTLLNMDCLSSKADFDRLYPVAKMLIEKGANVDMQNQYGNTLLHFASFHELHDLITWLNGKSANTLLVNNCRVSASELIANKDVLTPSFWSALFSSSNTPPVAAAASAQDPDGQLNRAL